MLKICISYPYNFFEKTEKGWQYMKISIARIIVALVLVFALLFVSCTMDTPTEEPNNNSSGNG